MDKHLLDKSVQTQVNEEQVKFNDEMVKLLTSFDAEKTLMLTHLHKLELRIEALEALEALEELKEMYPDPDPNNISTGQCKHNWETVENHIEECEICGALRRV